jgi:uncharacterized protein YjbI with pentapeptide repeats
VKRRAQRDRDIAREARLDQILTGYIDDMSSLVLDRNLLRSRFGSDVQGVARMLTLATVRRLDARRKGEVLRYLMDARLLGVGGRAGSGAPGQGRPRIRIDIEGADLRGADLSGEVVSGWLKSVDLREARFDSAYLDGVQFNASDLRGASFRKALSLEADFTAARLNNAVFQRFSVVGDTSFESACLTNASFRSANLRDARWRNARGVSVNFVDATGIGARELQHAFLADTDLGAAKEVIGALPKGWGQEKSQDARFYSC